MSRIYDALEKAELDSGKTQDIAPPEELSPTGDTEELVVLGKPGSLIAEQFRYLRSRVTKPLYGKETRSILVAGAAKGDGKTFVACNLAGTIAQGLDEHVLLVDADLRNPRIHEVFGHNEDQEGLSNHLRDGVPLDQLLQKTAIGKLTYLPAGNATENPAELISSSRMKRFIAEVTQRYTDRFVIFDSPPVELAPESAVLAREMQGVLLIIRMGKTPRDIIKSSLEKFPQENFLGLVFNGQKSRKLLGRSRKNGYGSGSYGYGYGYGYEKRPDKKKKKAK